MGCIMCLFTMWRLHTYYNDNRINNVLYRSIMTNDYLNRRSIHSMHLLSICMFVVVVVVVVVVDEDDDDVKVLFMFLLVCDCSINVCLVKNTIIKQ